MSKKDPSAPPVNLGIDIIKRFMSEEELNKFLDQYQAHKHGIGSPNRVIFLQRELTPEDMDLLMFYINETDIPLTQYCEEHKIPITSAFGRITRSAVRYLAQHPEMLPKNSPADK